MKNKRKILVLELLILFGGIPVLLLVYQTPVIKLITLFTATLWAILILNRSLKVQLKSYFFFINKNISWGKYIFKLVIISVIILALGFIFRKEPLFLTLYDPLIILLLIIGYPIISVLPQEIIYRLYFFDRYRILFKNKFLAILTSALLFAFMHIIYSNPIAIIFTFFGGFLFSFTYCKTRSLLLTVIEHTLYGYFIFLAGFGQYFLSENMFQILFHTR